MIDLTSNRTNEKYTYRRVSWPSMQEGAELGNITSGGFELSAQSDLKAICSFSFYGEHAPDPNELIRIYYSFTDDNGESAEYPIGTFFIGYDTTTNIANYEYNGTDVACNGLRVSGQVDGWSVLKVLQDAKVGYPYAIESDTNAITLARHIIEEHGLRCAVDIPSTYETRTNQAFEPTDSWLTVVNWLCTTAGYQAPYPDAYGNVLITQYVAPEKRSPVFTFANDDKSIMYPEVIERNDWQSTPNVVRVIFASDAKTICAYAKNMRGSKASLEARGGRELTLVEQISELSGEDDAEMLVNIESIARKKLLDNSSEIEHVTLSHPYIPVCANDAIAINYADKSWSGNIMNISGTLAPSTKCTTEIRRFVENVIEIETDAAVVDYGD